MEVGPQAARGSAEGARWPERRPPEANVSECTAATDHPVTAAPVARRVSSGRGRCGRAEELAAGTAAGVMAAHTAQLNKNKREHARAMDTPKRKAAGMT
mmetsp:Transcript_11296/g.30270  ORF Transcript_11296/g.30270 Transcript_11296/m.30270 type:complete len:99 (-) Transcript_11296:3-299(-)